MPSLPPQPRLPPRPSQQSNQEVRRPAQVPPLLQGAGVRKVRPLIYAIGIAGIVGSGALIGAYLKTDQQQEAARKDRQVLLQPQTENPSPTAPAAPKATTQTDADIVYSKSIDMLQSRRAQLMAQRVGLETKLRDFRASQMRKEGEERRRKEFGLKR